MKVQKTVYPDTTPLYLALKKETKKKFKNKKGSTEFM